MNYKLTNSDAIVKINDNGTETWIPFLDQYSDYISYLKWLSEGNEPLPADE